MATLGPLQERWLQKAALGHANRLKGLGAQWGGAQGGPGRGVSENRQDHLITGSRSAAQRTGDGHRECLAGTKECKPRPA